jgi:hypothetical protein
VLRPWKTGLDILHNLEALLLVGSNHFLNGTATRTAVGGDEEHCKGICSSKGESSLSSGVRWSLGVLAPLWVLNNPSANFARLDGLLLVDRKHGTS